MLYFVGFFVSFSLAFLLLVGILAYGCIHIYLTLLGVWGLLFRQHLEETKERRTKIDDFDILPDTRGQHDTIHSKEDIQEC